MLQPSKFLSTNITRERSLLYDSSCESTNCSFDQILYHRCYMLTISWWQVTNISPWAVSHCGLKQCFPTSDSLLPKPVVNSKCGFCGNLTFLALTSIMFSYVSVLMNTTQLPDQSSLLSPIILLWSMLLVLSMTRVMQSSCLAWMMEWGAGCTLN